MKYLKYDLETLKEASSLSEKELEYLFSQFDLLSILRQIRMNVSLRVRSSICRHILFLKVPNKKNLIDLMSDCAGYDPQITAVILLFCVQKMHKYKMDLFGYFSDRVFSCRQERSRIKERRAFMRDLTKETRTLVFAMENNPQSFIAGVDVFKILRKRMGIRRADIIPKNKNATIIPIWVGAERKKPKRNNPIKVFNKGKINRKVSQLG